MNFLPTTKETVRNEICNGQTCENIFLALNQRSTVYGAKYKVEDVKDWFDWIKKQDEANTLETCENNFSDNSHIFKDSWSFYGNSMFPPKSSIPLIRLIYKEYCSAEKEVLARKCHAINCKLQMLSERYGIDTQDGIFGGFHCFVLYDFLKGQSKTIKLNGSFPSVLINKYNLVVLNSNHFFFISQQIQPEENSRCIVYLLKLDYHFLKCSILDMHSFKEAYHRLIFDSSDKNSFLLQVDAQTDLQLTRRSRFYAGKVVGQKLVFEEAFISDNEYDLKNSTVTLTGNKLCILAADNTQGPVKNLIFQEMEIKENKVHFLDYLEVKTDAFFEAGSCLTSCNVWSGRKCYILRQQRAFGDLSRSSSSYCAQLITVDLDSKKMTHSKFYEHLNATNLLIDDDGMLNVFYANPNTKQHVCNRLPINHPDKLQTLVHSFIKKKLRFMEATQHNQLIKELPAQFRPDEKPIIASRRVTPPTTRLQPIKWNKETGIKLPAQPMHPQSAMWINRPQPFIAPRPFIPHFSAAFDHQPLSNIRFH